jgi:hypothetical protein
LFNADIQFREIIYHQQTENIFNTNSIHLIKNSKVNNNVTKIFENNIKNTVSQSIQIPLTGHKNQMAHILKF